MDSATIIRYLTIMDLEIDQELTESEIKSQYRKLCLIYHPDQSVDYYKNGKKFIQLTEAKDYLLENLDYVNYQISSNFTATADSFVKWKSSKAQREAKARAQHEAEERARKAAEEAHRQAEERARQEAEQKARRQAEEEIRRKEEERIRKENERKKRQEEAEERERQRRLEKEKQEKIQRRKDYWDEHGGTITFICLVVIGFIALLISVLSTKDIVFHCDNYELKIGDSIDIPSYISPSTAINKDCIYISSDESIVYFDGHTAMAVGVGKVVITATQNGKEYSTCTIDVHHIEPKTMSINTNGADYVEGKIGRELNLTFEFTPANTSDKKVKYSSSDNEILLARYGKVSCVAEGEAILTVTHKTTGLTTDVAVKVTPVEIEKLKIKNSTTFYIGDSEELKADFYPTDTTNQELSWKTSNTSIISIKDNILYANKEGTATITARHSSGITDSMEIHVQPVEGKEVKISNSSILGIITAGDSVEFTANIFPKNTTDKSISWESSNPSVLSIDKKGNAKAIKPGSARVTATLKNGVTSGMYITVKPAPQKVKNGFITRPSSGYCCCPIKINAPSNNSIYATFTCASNPSQNFSMYIAANTSAEVDVPVGRYNFFYASGTTWYGKEYQFGDNTSYYTTDDIINCYTSGNYANGSELTLYGVSNGNMETDSIPESSFPVV